jgi:hypothetical protein
MRIQQFRRIVDKSGGSSPARDFKDALLVGLHNVLVADPDNRIIFFHVKSPSCPSPTGYAMMSRIVP